MVLASAPHFLFLKQKENRGNQTANGRILSKLAVMVVRSVMERGAMGATDNRADPREIGARR